MKKTLKKWHSGNLLIIISVILSFFYVVIINVHAMGNDETYNDLTKDFRVYTPSITDDFEDDEVIVILRKGYGSLNGRIDTTALGFEKIHGDDPSSKAYVDSKSGIIINSIEDISCLEKTERIKDIDNYTQIIKITLRSGRKEDVLNLVKQLNELDSVQFAEPNYIYDVSNCSNDTWYESQWNIAGVNSVGVADAWSLIGTGNTSPLIRVGVFEKSMQLGHQDLRTISGSFAPSSSVSTIHGTHVAGIVGAITGNSLGIAGISQVEIALLDPASFVESITWAINNDIRIINASFVYKISGTTSYAMPSNYHIAAINNFKLSDGLLVCAAGNDSNDNDDNSPYPASYANSSLYPSLTNVISVGAVDEFDNRCSFSNFGENSVSIYAPGEDILSTFPTDICSSCSHMFYDGTRLCEFREDLAQYAVYLVNELHISWDYIENHFSDLYTSFGEYLLEPSDCVAYEHCSNGYHYMSGTSMAAPHVAGLAALLLSIDQDLTFQQLRLAIIQGSDSIIIGVGGYSVQVVKKMNAYKSVKYVLENYSNTQYDLGIYSVTTSTTKAISSGNSYFDEKNGFYSLNVSYANNHVFNITSSSTLGVKLYDSNFNELTYETTNITSGIRVSKYLSCGRYYLRVYLQNSYQSGSITTEIVGSHNHSYDTYVYFSRYGHKSGCACGLVDLMSDLKPHVVSASSNGNRFRQCLECNYWLDMNYDYAIIDMGRYILFSSANGSYILPSGVIVIADADIELYMTQSLLFGIDGVFDRTYEQCIAHFIPVAIILDKQQICNVKREENFIS